MIEQGCQRYIVSSMSKNGAEALALVPEINPDLVLTDVRMPVMDGITLVEALNKRMPGLPVVIVSGFKEFEYARKALATGVVDYLLKPVSSKRMRELLDSLEPTLEARRENTRMEMLYAAIHGG
jgi:YesN/AraC family two-component response regulator